MSLGSLKNGYFTVRLTVGVGGSAHSALTVSKFEKFDRRGGWGSALSANVDKCENFDPQKRA